MCIRFVVICFQLSVFRDLPQDIGGYLADILWFILECSAEKLERMIVIVCRVCHFQCSRTIQVAEEFLVSERGIFL